MKKADGGTTNNNTIPEDVRNKGGYWLDEFEVTAKRSSFIKKIVNKVLTTLIKMDLQYLYGSDEHTARPKMKQPSGFTSVGGGANRNVNSVGKPVFTDNTGINSGHLAGMSSPAGVQKGKDLDDFDDLFDSDGSQLFKKFSELVDYLSNFISGENSSNISNENSINTSPQLKKVNADSIRIEIKAYQINKDGSIQSINTFDAIRKDTVGGKWKNKNNTILEK
ncbi:MAG: hypothetical protein HND27_10785 [Bacteroidetes bacterium]|nr:hypothetical protein [Bacteroidota bacterium]NOG96247.1 hypothetical protein [Bacteroidota bacterium]